MRASRQRAVRKHVNHDSMTTDSTDEPPSPRGRMPAPFLIGKDSRGHWVAQDSSGLHGGLFIDCNQALKYAMFENGHRPQDVIMVPGILELDIGNKPVVGAAAFRDRRAHGTDGS